MSKNRNIVATIVLIFIFATLIFSGFVGYANSAETRKISFSLRGEGILLILPNDATGKINVDFKNKVRGKKYRLEIKDINRRGSTTKLFDITSGKPELLYVGRISKCKTNFYVRWRRGPKDQGKKNLNTGAFRACLKEQRTIKHTQNDALHWGAFLFVILLI